MTKMTVVSGCSLSCSCLSGFCSSPGSLQGGEGDSQALRLSVRCCRWLLQGKLPEDWESRCQCKTILHKTIHIWFMTSIVFREMSRDSLWLPSLMVVSRQPPTLPTMSSGLWLMFPTKENLSTPRSHQDHTSQQNKHVDKRIIYWYLYPFISDEIKQIYNLMSSYHYFPNFEGKVLICDVWCVNGSDPGSNV